MYEQDKLKDFPIGKVYNPNTDNFISPFKDMEISSKFQYYHIGIYYNRESKEYKYVE